MSLVLLSYAVLRLLSYASLSYVAGAPELRSFHSLSYAVLRLLNYVFLIRFFIICR